MTIDVHVHSEPKSTVLPYLNGDYLPTALNQQFTIIKPPAESSLVIASFAPPDDPPVDKPWAVGVTDFTRKGEAEFWFWSSIEASDDIDNPERLEEAYALLRSMIALIAENVKDKKTLAIGSLHPSFHQFIPKHSLRRTSHAYTKFVFTPNGLPKKVESEIYDLRDVSDADLEQVVTTSTISRTVDTLRQSSSTGAYLRNPTTLDTGAHAWCFTAREGTISSLFVRGELRGKGPAKLVMRKELEKAFEVRGFVCADVEETNVSSVGVCQSLGASRLCKAIWVDIDLESFL